MERPPPTEGGESSTGKGKVGRKPRTRFTVEQIENLEKFFEKSPYPTDVERATLLLDEPSLRGITNHQLRVWFQNRRGRSTKRKGKSMGAAEKKDKMDEKRRKFTSESLHCTITEAHSGGAGEASSSEIRPVLVLDSSEVVRVAHETRDEFLSKALGTALNWIPIPAFKSPNTTDGLIYTCDASPGVAVHTRAVVPIEPVKIIELLKDRTSWSWDCWCQDVHAMYQTSSGECIELIYTRFYSTTTETLPRDFWTLRYTGSLEDGSFVVCEKSFSATEGFPYPPITLEFVRASMMASGYLIRRVKEGSTIIIVDHVDLEASSVPLYQSSELVARKMTVAAIRYIKRVATDEKIKSKTLQAMRPASVRSLGRTLTRGFNEAMTCSIEDGWNFIREELSSDFVTCVKHEVKGVDPVYDGVICIKASLPFEDISPTKLVRLLKERLSDWMRFNFSEHSAALSRSAQFVFPGGNTHNLSPRSLVLGEIGCKDEALEVVRFNHIENHLPHESREDIYHLQLINGLEESNIGTVSEFIFSPVYRSGTDVKFSDNMLSSGFRAISNTHSTLFLAFQFPFEIDRRNDVVAMARLYVRHIISTIKKDFMKDIEVPATGSSSAFNFPEADQATDPATELSSGFNFPEVDPATGLSSVFNFPEVDPATGLSSVFNFPEADPATGLSSVFNFPEVDPATGLSSVFNFPEVDPATGLSSVFNFPEVDPATGSSSAVTFPDPAPGLNFNPGLNNAVDLAKMIVESYRSHSAVDMPFFSSQDIYFYEKLEHYSYAVLCFTIQSPFTCLYANQAALNLLDMTSQNMHLIEIDKILSQSMPLQALLSTLMDLGYALTPEGCFITARDCIIKYKEAMAWLVYTPDGLIHSFALSIHPWTRIHF